MPFSRNPTGTHSRRHPAHFVSALYTIVALVSACSLWEEEQVSKPKESRAPDIVRLGDTLPKPPPAADALRGTLVAPLPPSRPFRVEPYAPTDSGWIVRLVGPPGSEMAGPVDVVGLSEDETIDLLGEPVERYWRPPARVLRYASMSCAVDIYFYLDVAKDKFKALQVEGPELASDGQDLKVCLGKVRDERRTQ
ncbi:MAG: hypothetical protein EXQ98_01990 [Alphaproteobacteria bacterium]|nr:hypothetical protein [Alphaproteobacteria bacterium]